MAEILHRDIAFVIPFTNGNEMPTNSCPICGRPAKTTRDDDESVLCRCDTCGKFKITEEAWWVFKDNDSSRRKIQWVLRRKLLVPDNLVPKLFKAREIAQRTPGGVVIEDMLAVPVPESDRAQLIDFLELLNRKYPQRGAIADAFGLDVSDLWISNKAELLWLSDLAVEQGYLRETHLGRVLTEAGRQLRGQGNKVRKESADRKKVFVIHGRDEELRMGLFQFLRSIGLHPVEWSEAAHQTGKATPETWEIVTTALSTAAAIVALFSPDEAVSLREELRPSHQSSGEAGYQPRPNVLVEAGVALGIAKERLCIVQIGEVRALSDLAGLHILKIDNSPQKRKEFADRLKNTGCAVDLLGTDWLTAGKLECTT